MFKYLSIIILLVSSGPGYANPNDVVATVNGKKITRAILEKNFKEYYLLVSNKMVTRERVLNDIINRELGVQRAKTQKIDKDPGVAFKIDSLMYNAQISKDLENKLRKISVTNKDVEDYYRNNKEYRTAHILFRLNAKPKEEQWKEAMAKADATFDILSKDPEKFAELANRYSHSTSAKNGGDIGFKPAAQLAPEYYLAIKGKKPGYISGPVRSQFGYHIIKVLAIKDVSELQMPVYKKIVYDIKRDKVLEEYFAGLRKKAKIQINKKFL